MTDFEHQDDLINLEYLLDNVDDFNFDWLPGPADNSPESGTLSIEDINRHLLNDEELELLLSDSQAKDSNLQAIEDVDQYLVNDVVELLSDSPPQDSSSSPDSNLQVVDDMNQYLVSDGAVLSDSPPKDSTSSPDSVMVQSEGLGVNGSPNAAGDGTIEDDDDSDPADKQRKRKLRNKDAAMRSRERKKLYVHDLEMKSKFYEAECRRLGNLLQCCLAENQALRFSLHNSKVFDASVSGQESAVLFLELLLLGSLLGPLGLICLLILPSQLLSTLEAGLLRNGAKELGRVAQRKSTSDVIRFLVPESFMIGKRCKASRSRFKDEAGWPLANLFVA